MGEGFRLRRNSKPVTITAARPVLQVTTAVLIHLALMNAKLVSRFSHHKSEENTDPVQNASHYRRAGIILRHKVSKLHNGKRFSVAGCEQFYGYCLADH